MRNKDELSSTCHKVDTTVRVPAIRNALDKFAMPSCPCSGPTAVSQAESTTTSASNRSCTISEACKNPSSPARRSLNRTKAARSGNVESAYGIASLLNNLFGRGKEPFRQQAYTNL